MKHTLWHTRTKSLLALCLLALLLFLSACGKEVETWTIHTQSSLASSKDIINSSHDISPYDGRADLLRITSGGKLADLRIISGEKLADVEYDCYTVDFHSRECTETPDVTVDEGDLVLLMTDVHAFSRNYYVVSMTTTAGLKLAVLKNWVESKGSNTVYVLDLTDDFPDEPSFKVEFLSKSDWDEIDPLCE